VRRAPGSPAWAQSADFKRYQVDLGAAPTYAAEALSTLPHRVDTVVQWNACGREKDFTDSVLNKDTAEETPLAAVMGKIVWLKTHATYEACKQRVRLFDPDPQLTTLINRFDYVFNPRTPTEGNPNGTHNCPVPIADSQAIDVPIAQGGTVRAWDVYFEVTWACMRDQVNIALMAAKKGHQHLGTTDLPCGFWKDPGPTTSTDPSHPAPPYVWTYSGEGDWDVKVRDFLRVVYLDRAGSVAMLDKDTRSHVLNDLVTVSGPMEETKTLTNTLRIVLVCRANIARAGAALATSASGSMPINSSA
jgi:hypothetical protein